MWISPFILFIRIPTYVPPEALPISLGHGTMVSQGMYDTFYILTSKQTKPHFTAVILAMPWYSSSFLLKVVQSFQQEEHAAGSPHNELKLYLESGVESTEDIIAWWGVHFYLCLTAILSHEHVSTDEH
jgi:hypothetical protein